jgi:hypothetical protein
MLMLAVVAPVFQVYVLAPLAVKISGLPEQRVGDAGEIAMVGLGFTVIVLLATCVQVPAIPLTV